jgi:cation transport protein ChaC
LVLQPESADETAEDFDTLMARGRALVTAHESLAAPASDFWVFGYGSLIWNPGFPHIEVRPARLTGYHRQFCIYSHVYRGTPEEPGLVFGLDRGGSCRGLAFRVPRGEGADVLAYLAAREMVTAVYIPRWLRVETDAGPLRAITFIADRKHYQYAGKLPLDKMVRIIRRSCGVSGTTIDYLENTVHHLEALGLEDSRLKKILAAARRAGDTP